MSQFINIKKTRINLIQYFKAIHKSQRQIQSIQELLISHVRFNPIILYKKIALSNNRVSVKYLKEYFRTKIKINREQGIKLYMIKHQLLNKDDNDDITMQMFLQTLIPYTPNYLRDANQAIYRQLQTQHLDMTVEETYHKLVSVQIQNLYLIRLLQRQVSLPWKEVQKFMVRDILQKGKIIDLAIKEHTDIIYVRKWMQLWTDVDQYEVLNLMRFFNGGKSQNILRMYDNNVTIEMKCSCASTSLKKQKNLKNTLNQQYFTKGSQSNIPKLRLQKQSQQVDHRIYPRAMASSNQQSYSNQIQQQLMDSSQVKLSTQTNQPNYQQKESQNKQLQLFLQYSCAFVQSQKFIEFNRFVLRPYKKEVYDFLHDILSKKKSATKLQKILLYVQKYINIKQKKFQMLIELLGSAKIENCAIFLLFQTQPTDKKSMISNHFKVCKKKLSPQQIIKNVSLVLHRYIQTKSLLINISSKFLGSSQQILKQIYINQKQKQKISIQDLSLLLKKHTMTQVNIKYLLLLMNHFGDGKQITSKSLIKRFQRQNYQTKSYKACKFLKQ